jgi:hypothetical protein
MCAAASIAELAATSLGWEQTMSVLQSYVRDPETRDMLEGLLAA